MTNLPTAGFDLDLADAKMAGTFEISANTESR